MKTASVRQLRTEFPKIRDVIEREGEIVVTERGRAAYIIRLYHAPKRRKVGRKNYLARLLSNMPRPISAEASRAIDELNRGER